MVVRVVNAQSRTPVDTANLTRVARCAARRLGLRGGGTLEVTCVDAQHLRAVNRDFLAHDRTTDVVSFRYDGEPITGEILVAPAIARRYAREHGLPYAEELARYVIHGLLHWLGEEDRTPRQRARMRRWENRLVAQCAALRDGHPHH